MASTASLETLLSSLTTKAKTFSHGDETSRRQLLEITRTLFYKLETPMEALFRICWVEVRCFQGMSTFKSILCVSRVTYALLRDLDGAY